MSEGKNREAVEGATFKELKETLQSIDQSGYFKDIPAVEEVVPIAPVAPEPVPAQAPESQTLETSVAPVEASGVSFIQESSLPDIAGDPAILSMVPPPGAYPGQYSELELKQQFEGGNLIPTQTFTNQNYAGYQAAYVTPVTLANPQMIAPQLINQAMQPILQQDIGNPNVNYEQSEYNPNLDQLRQPGQEGYVNPDDYNGQQGQRNRGRGGGYRGPRNANGQQTNGYSRGGRGGGGNRGDDRRVAGDNRSMYRHLNASSIYLIPLIFVQATITIIRTPKTVTTTARSVLHVKTTTDLVEKVPIVDLERLEAITTLVVAVATIVVTSNNRRHRRPLLYRSDSSLLAHTSAHSIARLWKTRLCEPTPLLPPQSTFLFPFLNCVCLSFLLFLISLPQITATRALCVCGN